jgi:hypothetical protein
MHAYAHIPPLTANQIKYQYDRHGVKDELRLYQMILSNEFRDKQHQRQQSYGSSTSEKKTISQGNPGTLTPL